MVDSNPHFAMLCQNPFSSEKHKSVEAFNNGFVNGLMSDQNRIYVNVAEHICGCFSEVKVIDSYD